MAVPVTCKLSSSDIFWDILLAPSKSVKSRLKRKSSISVVSLFVYPHEHLQTVRWERINCHPLATSERWKHTFTLCHKCFLFVSLSFCFLHLSTSLHFLPHMTMMHTKHRLLLMTGQQGKDTDKLTHPELSCHLCHFELVFLCLVFFCCCWCVCFVKTSPWAERALWEVTVNTHKLGLMSTGPSLVIILQTERTWLMCRFVQEKVLLWFQRAYSPPTHSQYTK